MNARLQDQRIRVAAFEWLTDQVRLHSDVLPRDLLAQGFDFEGNRVPLLGPQGIFKPRVMPETPLSITTVPSGPYDDTADQEGLLLYRYRGTDTEHRDNHGLRTAMARRVPLVYFYGLLPGRYLAIWPVFIVGDDPRGLTFRVAVDDSALLGSLMQEPERDDAVAEPATQARRAYVTATVRQRLHQRSFRERVLRAYRNQCSLCRLRHRELLDAAHIIPDGEPDGEPVVPNGLALCKLHHAAFDRNFLGIRPDYVVEVQPRVLRERDGPMLVHGLKAVHLQKIMLPRSRTMEPDPDLLARRYERFRAAG